MKYGAIFPQYEVGSDIENIRKFMLSVEAMGYDYVLAYDHVLGANPERDYEWTGPYTHQTQFHEVFSLFSYAAAITTKLEFATGILILPQRQTALVAKQAAQVDLFSNGRFRLGVGVGWNQVELEGLGEEFSTRGRRSAEQVEVLQLLWQNELVTFDGEFHHLDDVGINPLPIQRPIPVWFGGGADAVLKRMAKYGAGWMPGGMALDRVQPRLEKLHGYLEAEGRNPADFGIDPFVSLARIDEDEQLAYIDQWQSLGATHASILSMHDGFTTVDEHLAALEKFIKKVK
ncbi:MAG: LLM class F420-dependent oxidoreductase [Phototrophicaceae bacterium]